MNKKDLEKKAHVYALKNAIAYNGKAQQGAIISSLFNEGLKKEEVKEYIKDISKILNKVNLMSLEDQKKEFEKIKNEVSNRVVREGLPELPNVKKSGVIMRFAPAASGPLHIGHIISNMISSLYVKKYGGKFYIRIEDTNPENTDKDCYKSFKIDCDWLFGNVTEYIIQSDRIGIYYKYAVKIINKNKAYVCTCSGDEFREYVKEKKDCPCRRLSIIENLNRWKKMLAPQAYPDKSSKKISDKGNKKGFKQGEAVLRFKSDMKHPNPAMRDFPLARINTQKHPRQGSKYRVWPLMNLAVPVDDIEYKMTHIIRGKDHADNAKRQKMIYDVLGKKYPWTFFMGKLKFSDLELSKRKIKAAIEAGKYTNWEDERLPTIASLRKRGYKPEAFAKLAEQRGLIEVDRVMTQKEYFTLLDHFNKIKKIYEKKE